MGTNIASERVKAGLDQNALASKLGTSVSTVSRWERSIGKRPDGDQLVAMSELFGCSIDYLLGISEDRIVR